MKQPPGDATRLLEAIDAGDAQAADELLPIVYQELRRLAHARMAKEGSGHTLQPTALVHEAYLRLFGGDNRWQNRAHFFAAAAEAMRRILIERARRVGRVRHGGALKRVELETGDTPSSHDVEDLLAIDLALEKLEQRDARTALVVKMRTYAGLTVPETAKALDISARTVDRLWRSGRAFLGAQLAGEQKEI